MSDVRKNKDSWQEEQWKVERKRLKARAKINAVESWSVGKKKINSKNKD